jgi:tyrosyl-tRNA synthetase
MNTELKYDIITRGLQEVLGGEIIKGILAQGKNPKCYWGEHHHRVQPLENL